MRILVLGLLFLVGWGGIAMTQVSSSASCFASSEEPVRVSIGTFVFEQGERLALELFREEPCPCLCDELSVTGFRVLDGEGAVIYEVPGDYPAPAGEWVGRWGLTDAAGTPVPPGSYTALVETSLREFRVELQVVAPGERPSGRSLARASVCGLGLRVYRLLTEEDDGAVVSLQEGEFLMVALPGNPTTGYEWAPTEEPPFLTRIPGVDYLSEASLIGGGGTFFFRYEATGQGEGPLSFAYRRPWESGPPENTYSILVIVR
ncbi:protease inhibitor I42 family protein [Candidatus Bipolaricaulota bacterium]|nr:protease inhibitor I42 family protein [Candidatus Bipolaricaulota bacterium]